MYKKVVLTKQAGTPVDQLNDTAREKIKDFLLLNGWTLNTQLSNGCNYCLTKDFSGQNAVDNSDLTSSILNGFKTLRESNQWTNFDANGTLHLSIAKPLHNARVLFITPAENPSNGIVYNGVYHGSSNNSNGCGDTDITSLCSQCTGYTDSTERYDVPGVDRCIGSVKVDTSGQGTAKKSFDTTSWSYNQTDKSVGNCHSVPGTGIRLDDMVTEVQIEMYYFTDNDLQEEFYVSFRCDKMFGRIAPENSKFYQTFGFVKIPGFPILGSSTILESPNALTGNNYVNRTFDVLTDSNGLKGLVNFGINSGNTLALCQDFFSWASPRYPTPNLNTVVSVTDSWNPRWDAPDTTPNLWIHHALCFYNPPLDAGYGSIKDPITSISSGQNFSRHTIDFFGIGTFFYCPYYKQIVDGYEHTIYGVVRADYYFGSFDFFYDQSCSSQTGTSLLVPIQRIQDVKAKSIGPRHCKRYNVFYSLPEKILEPEEDSVSLKWKSYPYKRRSIQGYINFLNKDFTFSGWKNPITNTTHDVWVTYTSSGSVTRDLHWFIETENEETGQPFISDSTYGFELDASGFEGFAIDYSDYDPSNTEEIAI